MCLNLFLAKSIFCLVCLLQPFGVLFGPEESQPTKQMGETRTNYMRPQTLLLPSVMIKRTRNRKLDIIIIIMKKRRCSPRFELSRATECCQKKCLKKLICMVLEEILRDSTANESCICMPYNKQARNKERVLSIYGSQLQHHFIWKECWLPTNKLII